MFYSASTGICTSFESRGLQFSFVILHKNLLSINFNENTDKLQKIQGVEEKELTLEILELNVYFIPVFCSPPFHKTHSYGAHSS